MIDLTKRCGNARYTRYRNTDDGQRPTKCGQDKHGQPRMQGTGKTTIKSRAAKPNRIRQGKHRKATK